MVFMTRSFLTGRREIARDTKRKADSPEGNDRKKSKGLYVKFCGYPPIQEEALDGWGTLHFFGYG
jgi:hypothetical protein